MTAEIPVDPTLKRRLRTYPMLLLVALGAAFAFVILAGSGSSTASGRVGGDFPAFYGAGTIVAAGDVDGLYDLEVQAAAQAGLLGDADGFIMYPYAPHVAAAYAPLSAIPYRLAYVIHTAGMVAAFVAALALIRPMAPLVGRWFGATVAGALTAYPIFAGVMGGQNTALSLLLVAAAWRAWAEDRDGLAGVALAVLLFRPQYALPLVGLALLDRRWRTVATASIGAAAVWAANAALAGVGWITFWYDGVQPLLKMDAEINAVNEIAPIGVLVALFGDTTVPVVLGGIVSVAIGIGLMRLWWRPRLDLTARMAITAAALPLLGPHAIYYDSALVLFTVVVLMDRGRLPAGGAVLVWLAGFLHLTRSVVDASPIVVVILAVVGVAVARLGATGQPRVESDRVLPIQDSYRVR